MTIHYVGLLLVIQCFFSCSQVPDYPQSAESHFLPLTDTEQLKNPKTRTPLSNVLFKSEDEGQSWQDISAGLPEDAPVEDLFVSDSDIYMNTKTGMYRSSHIAKGAKWEKEIFLDSRGTNIAFGKTCVYAYNYEGYIFQKSNGSGMWLPVFTNFTEKLVRTVFETSEGIIFIGCDGGLFKSADRGSSWKRVLNSGWVLKIVESEGVLIATNQQGIVRSSDKGETWELVISEGGVGIAAQKIKDGFAAITYNTESKTRRIRMTNDKGKTWQTIDAGLPEQASVSSIIKVGQNLFCGHPDGIYLSSDNGKSWKLVLPSIGKKVYNLSAAGNTIYALPQEGGC